MDNLQPSNISPDELPEGFTIGGPPGAAVGGDGSGGNDSSSQKAAAMEEQKQAILEQALTPDALARLRRIKLVKQQNAREIENAIASMAMAGQLPGRISEGKLIEMLERKSAASASKSASSSKISIQRKNYGIDSDDEDDNDDDLM